MKHKFNKKKRIAIASLSAAAVCLAGGLFWYTGIQGDTQLPTTQAESQTEVEAAVNVPEIESVSTSGPVAAASELAPESEEAKEPEIPSVPESSKEPDVKAKPTVSGDSHEVKAKPSAGKPKRPAEATPPAKPPKEEDLADASVENPDADGQRQPEHVPQTEADQPQGGETNAAGEIYVPGFGYVEISGPVEGIPSYTDGDWNKQIGTMQ